MRFLQFFIRYLCIASVVSRITLKIINFHENLEFAHDTLNALIIFADSPKIRGFSSHS